VPPRAGEAETRKFLVRKLMELWKILRLENKKKILELIENNSRYKITIFPSRQSTEATVEDIQADEGCFLSWASIREMILDYFDRKCYKCGKSEEEQIRETGNSLEVHHISPVEFSQRPYERDLSKSFVPLCSKCHRRGSQ